MSAQKSGRKTFNKTYNQEQHNLLSRTRKKLFINCNIIDANYEVQICHEIANCFHQYKIHVANDPYAQQHLPSNVAIMHFELWWFDSWFHRSFVLHLDTMSHHGSMDNISLIITQWYHDIVILLGTKYISYSWVVWIIYDGCYYGNIFEVTY